MGLSFDILQNISVEKDQVPVIHVLRSRIGNIMDPTPARDPSTGDGQGEGSPKWNQEEACL